MSSFSHSDQHSHQSLSDEMLNDKTHNGALTGTNWLEISSIEAAHRSIRDDLSLYFAP